MSKVNKYWISSLTGLVFVTIFLITTDWSGLLDALLKANYWYLIPACLLYQASTFCRAFRWRILLRHIKKISTLNLYPIVVVGYMANNLLPLRVGELVRAYYIGERESISSISALTTIFIERLFDALTLLLFLVVLAVFVPMMELAKEFSNLSNVPWFLLPIIISVPFIAMFVVLIISAYRPSIIENLMSVLIRPIPNVIGQRILHFARLGILGLESLKDPKLIFFLFILSLPIWILESALFFVVGYSFSLNEFYSSFADMVAAILIVTSLSNIGSSIPSTPGGIGLFELIARETLVLLPIASVDRSIAAAYVVVVHAVLIIPMIVLGQVFLLTGNMTIKKIWRNKDIWDINDYDSKSLLSLTDREDNK